MHEPEIALVFAPEPWFEALHQHLTDHGGARVRQVVMDPALALVEAYDALVVSHRWPALTHRFVEQVHALDRSVLGVYESGEPAGREFLVRLGVDGTIGHDTPMPAFLDALSALPIRCDRERADALATREAGSLPEPGDDRSAAAAERLAHLTVVTGTPGAGRTEVALALAFAVARTGERVLLADVDESNPSLAQRLGLPIEPNVRTAIEAVAHGTGDPERCTTTLSPALDLLCGLPNVALWSQIRRREVRDVIGYLTAGRRHVIADVASSIEELDVGGRGRFEITRALVAQADTIISVGLATPVGANRLLGLLAGVRDLNRVAPVHLVVNRSDRSAFREAEIERELRRTFEPASFTFVPEDRRIDGATWAAEVATHGLFVRAIGRVSAVAFPVPGRPDRLRGRGRVTGSRAVPA